MVKATKFEKKVAGYGYNKAVKEYPCDMVTVAVTKPYAMMPEVYYIDRNSSITISGYDYHRKSNRVAGTDIQRVIFNGPATIVFWYDGTKTVVKCGSGDVFDREKGLGMAIMKKLYGADFHKVVKTYTAYTEEDKEEN